MNNQKLASILGLIAPQIIQQIVQNQSVDEITATRGFYNSKVYELLEQEDTKMWHLSPMALYTLYEEEMRTGHITIPEEA